MSDLFDFNNVRVADNQSQPLSHRLRPQRLKDLIGQDHITSKTGPLNNIIKNNNQVYVANKYYDENLNALYGSSSVNVLTDEVLINNFYNAFSLWRNISRSFECYAINGKSDTPKT